MAYKPYRCGVDCRGGYYCLICLLVFNFRKLSRKLGFGKKGAKNNSS
jgi:hypothetical protein